VTLADGDLVEFRMMIRPAEDMSLYKAEMAIWDGDGLSEWREQQREWVAANDGCRRDILYRLEDSGPMTSRELPDTCEVPWQSSGWNNNRNVRLLLGMMELRGQVAVVGWRGRDRLWDLAERVFPDGPVVPFAEALRIRDERRLRSLGIARARSAERPDEPDHVDQAGALAVVQGLRGQWRVDPELLDQPFRGRTAILSPLDRTIFDRKRMTEIFEFDYQLEMYKPVAQRRWGYYALPILKGDRFIGKVDATSVRQERILRVDAVHRDVPFDRATERSVAREIDELGGFLGLQVVYT
jgi:uncharacterized protein